MYNLLTAPNTILDSKIVHNKLSYLVDRLGHPPSDHTWEPVDSICNAQALVDDFHRHYPNKPSVFEGGIVS